MRIVALDPGKNHFAYAALNDDGRCVQTGHLDTITDLHHERIAAQLDRFQTGVEALLGRDGRDWLAVERMQHRPHLGGGAVSEYMNIMIGICFAVAHSRDVPIFPVLSSTWKNHTIRSVGVQDRKRFTMVGQKLALQLPPGSKHKTQREFCAGVLDGQPRARGLTPHEGDAVGIGCYVWERLTGKSIVASVLA